MAEQIQSLFQRQGWFVDWSGYGSVDDTLARWSARSLLEALSEEASVNFVGRSAALSERINALRESLTHSPLDPYDTTVPGVASQKVIALKQQRHELSQDLHTLLLQRVEARELLESLEHRIRTAADLLRLKKTGVGRLDLVECPTCHRDLDAAAFGLSEQSTESVDSHLEALKRDRELIRKNLRALDANVGGLEHELVRVDSELREANRALSLVTASVGSQREQIAKTAADLSDAEREKERVTEAHREVDAMQKLVDAWISDARSLPGGDERSPDREEKTKAFEDALRAYLVALGHSAVRSHNASQIRVDEQYTPLLADRRLSSLGSASDEARLVAAYTLALAFAASKVDGHHPGVAVLDEPLQQNPDSEHRELFVSFLGQQLAKTDDFQTLVFTWLLPDELDRLKEMGTEVLALEGEHFLNIVT